MKRSPEHIRPADAGAALSAVLAVLAAHIKTNPQLQRELLAALAPVVQVMPERRWFE